MMTIKIWMETSSASPTLRVATRLGEACCRLRPAAGVLGTFAMEGFEAGDLVLVKFVLNYWVQCGHGYSTITHLQ